MNIRISNADETCRRIPAEEYGDNKTLSAKEIKQLYDMSSQWASPLLNNRNTAQHEVSDGN